MIIMVMVTTIMTTIIITATISTTIIMAMTITIIGTRPTTYAVGSREMPGAEASGHRSSRA
jgi:accessory gene regulator protein AgrB